MLVLVGPGVSANAIAINKDVGVHTKMPVPSINSSCVRLASCLQPGCLGRLHVGRFEDRRRLYSGV